MGIDWAKLVFDPDWLNGLDNMAKKRFGNEGLAEEAATYVVNQLSENDWGMLKDFQGTSTPETYLRTVVKRLLEDFSRRRFGRPRPPSWLLRQGETWVALWKKICLERQPKEKVIMHYAKVYSADYISDSIRTIKAKLPWCGDSCREIPSSSLQPVGDEDDLEMEDTLVSYVTPEESLHQEMLDETLWVLAKLLDTEESDADEQGEKNQLDAAIDNSGKAMLQLKERISKIKARLSFSDDEIIVLRMVFQDGVKKSVVAKAMKMTTYQVNKLIENALQTILQIFVEEGMDATAMMDLLDNYGD